jgi:hypothetical protein
MSADKSLAKDHKSKTYEFVVAGKTYSIPAFSSLPAGALRQARKATDDLDKAFTILEYTLGLESDSLAAVDSMTVEEFGEFVKGWTDGVSVGESSDS